VLANRDGKIYMGNKSANIKFRNIILLYISKVIKINKSANRFNLLKNKQNVFPKRMWDCQGRSFENNSESDEFQIKYPARTDD